MEHENNRFKLEEEKSLIYDSLSDIDICTCYDEDLQIELLRVLNNSDFKELSNSKYKL